MQNRNQEIEKSIARNHDNKLKKLLKEAVLENDTSVVVILWNSLKTELANGAVIHEVSKAYFRLSRKDSHDCSPMFSVWNLLKEDLSDASITIHASLLDVLGYDKMIPVVEDQKKIIDKYFNFGDDTDYRYYSDPRYGLAAACAGWDFEVAEPFLKKCMTVKEVPLQYVSENSLKKKYVRLR